MFYAILIINGLTFLIAILTGVCCLRNSKSFPDTRAGYHMERATQDQESWKQANQVAGLLCILGSTVGFLIVPCLLFFLSVPLWGILCCYFFIVLLFLLLVLWGPLLLLKKKK